MLLAVGVGNALITTLVVAAAVQVPIETITEYVPAIAIVATGCVGFCKFDANATGPDHVYVVAAIEFNCIVDPTQNGPGLLAEVVGVVTITFTVPVAVQPNALTVTVYTPELTAVAAGMFGF